MKSEYTKKREIFTSSSYPYLGITEEYKQTIIVLFTSKNTGVVVGGDHSTYSVGYYGDWQEIYFSRFEGEIKLSN